MQKATRMKRTTTQVWGWAGGLLVATLGLQGQAAMPDVTEPVPGAAQTDTAAAPDAAAAEVVPAGPHSYLLDTRRSSFVVQVFKEGAASAFAHDHVISATDVRGTVVVDITDVKTARVDVEVMTAGLINDDPKLRKRFKIEGEMSPDDRQKVLENMRSADQLDVAQFPVMTFVSTAAAPVDATTVNLSGRLTMHGVTRDVNLPVKVKLDGDTIDGRGSLSLKTSDFGIKPFSAFFGAVKNKDTIILTVHLVAHRKK